MSGSVLSLGERELHCLFAALLWAKSVSLAEPKMKVSQEKENY